MTDYQNFSLVNCQGYSSSSTHNLKPMSDLYGYMMRKWISEKNVMTPEIIDPFARMCLWGTVRNDINPEFLQQFTTHNMDALDFMCTMPSGEAHGVIIDPPFSNRQSDEEYNTGNLYTNPAYMADIGLQCFRVLKPGGYVLKCGYNSNPPYKGFDLVKIKLCQFGASRNDVIMTLWQKNQSTLFQ